MTSQEHIWQKPFITAEDLTTILAEQYGIDNHLSVEIDDRQKQISYTGALISIKCSRCDSSFMMSPKAVCDSRYKLGYVCLNCGTLSDSELRQRNELARLELGRKVLLEKGMTEDQLDFKKNLEDPLEIGIRPSEVAQEAYTEEDLTSAMETMVEDATVSSEETPPSSVPKEEEKATKEEETVKKNSKEQKDNEKYAEFMATDDDYTSASLGEIAKIDVSEEEQSKAVEEVLDEIDESEDEEIELDLPDIDDIAEEIEDSNVEEVREALEDEESEDFDSYASPEEDESIIVDVENDDDEYDENDYPSEDEVDSDAEEDDFSEDVETDSETEEEEVEETEKSVESEEIKPEESVYSEDDDNQDNYIVIGEHVYETEEDFIDDVSTALATAREVIGFSPYYKSSAKAVDNRVQVECAICHTITQFDNVDHIGRTYTVGSNFIKKYNLQPKKCNRDNSAPVITSCPECKRSIITNGFNEYHKDYIFRCAADSHYRIVGSKNHWFIPSVKELFMIECNGKTIPMTMGELATFLGHKDGPPKDARLDPRFAKIDSPIQSEWIYAKDVVYEEKEMTETEETVNEDTGIEERSLESSTAVNEIQESISDASNAERDVSDDDIMGFVNRSRNSALLRQGKIARKPNVDTTISADGAIDLDKAVKEELVNEEPIIRIYPKAEAEKPKDEEETKVLKPKPPVIENSTPVVGKKVIKLAPSSETPVEQKIDTPEPQVIKPKDTTDRVWKAKPFSEEQAKAEAQAKSASKPQKTAEELERDRIRQKYSSGPFVESGTDTNKDLNEEMRFEQEKIKKTSVFKSNTELVLARQKDIAKLNGKDNPFERKQALEEHFENSVFGTFISDLSTFTDVECFLTVNNASFEVPIIDFESGLRIVCADLSEESIPKVPFSKIAVSKALPFHYFDPVARENDDGTFQKRRKKFKWVVLFTDSVVERREATFNALVKFINPDKLFYHGKKIQIEGNKFIPHIEYTQNDQFLRDFDVQNSTFPGGKPKTGQLGILVTWDNSRKEITVKETLNFLSQTQGQNMLTDLSTIGSVYNKYMAASIRYIERRNPDTDRIIYTITEYVELGGAMFADAFMLCVRALLKEYMTRYPQNRMISPHIVVEIDPNTFTSPSLKWFVDQGSLKRMVQVDKSIIYGQMGEMFTGVEPHIRYTYVRKPIYRRSTEPADYMRHDTRMFAARTLVKTMAAEIAKCGLQNLVKNDADRKLFISRMGYHLCQQAEIVEYVVDQTLVTQYMLDAKTVSLQKALDAQSMYQGTNMVTDSNMAMGMNNVMTNPNLLSRMHQIMTRGSNEAKSFLQQELMGSNPMMAGMMGQQPNFMQNQNGFNNFMNPMGFWGY